MAWRKDALQSSRIVESPYTLSPLMYFETTILSNVLVLESKGVGVR
jgi:hypothetical protein